MFRLGAVALTVASAHSDSGCIDDLVNIGKDFGEAGLALKGIVSDCIGDDRTKCQSDVDQFLQQLTVAVQDVSKSTTSCGSHGPDCVAEIKKLSDAINAIDEPAKKMADECAGKDKSIISCGIDGAKVGVDVLNVGKEVASVVSTCKNGESARSTGTKLDITWKDCGSKHGKITGLEPSSITTGTPATLTGTGTIDEDVTAATFQAAVKEGPITVASCKGDGTSDVVCKLPLGSGSITVKKVPFPLKKGEIQLPVVIATNANLPSMLQRVSIHLEAKDQNGDSALCLDAQTAPGSVGSDPNGIGCDLCKEIMGKAIDAGVSECHALCKKAGSFDGVCEQACDLISTECDGSVNCPAKVCGLVKLCSSDIVV